MLTLVDGGVTVHAVNGTARHDIRHGLRLQQKPSCSIVAAAIQNCQVQVKPRDKSVIKPAPLAQPRRCSFADHIRRGSVQAAKAARGAV